MAILKLTALAALGYAGWKYYERVRDSHEPAFATGQGTGDNFAKVRDAGPAAMADPPREEWSRVDEDSDQSFPASDPPGTY